MNTPRVRIFAGPNGSGKSTLATWLARDYAVNLYHFVNADILFAEIASTLRTACPFAVTNEALIAFAQESTFPQCQKDFFLSGAIRIEDDFVLFEPTAVNSYTVALLADFYRSEYLKNKASFSFETVFSHPGKVEFLRDAQETGYRTYMYFVATNEPEINLSRVENRVKHGGHDVPQDKIISRFSKSIQNATLALSFLNRAHFFDNSGTSPRFLGEMSDGCWRLYTTELPDWFRTNFISR